MQYNINTLPKWAQTHVANLERQLAEAKEKERRTVEGDTEVWLDSNYGEDQQPLPPGSSILFTLHGKRIRVNERDDKIYVMALGGALSILPAGGVNVVNLDIVDY